MAVLNAANDVAVEHFLDRRIKFTEIPRLITNVMEQTATGPADMLEGILQADSSARRLARELVKPGA
jgi:1-deoxy-D-xylulose-5-phosphate reductoisomerase